jgi:hypothetical protein
VLARRALLIVAPLLFGAAPPRTGPALPASPGEVRKAVERALPLLVKGAEGHTAKRTCFACHNQSVPMLAFHVARSRGLAVTEELVPKQAKFIAAFLDRNRAGYLKGRGQGGQADTAGQALFALELAGWKADATTAAVAEYLLLYQKERDHWRTLSRRPPSEASEFTTTYYAVRGLRKWGTPEQKARIAERTAKARAWLLKAAAKDTEDRAFRLLALAELGVGAEELRPAVQELLRSQRKDGGWGQLDTMASDAYATGTALVALHRAGKMATSDPAYRRGLTFLLATQRADGSWHVRSRSRPFQTYFESSFPHGKDQFISMAASGWATAALALACPPGARPAEKTARGERGSSGPFDGPLSKAATRP